MAVELLGSFANAGVDLIGNLLNRKSNKEANNTNLQIAQMGNEFNERMLDKQLRYNSAQEQVKRYKEAGLNPALMMQGQSAGQASTASAVPSSPVQPMQYDFSSIGSSLETALQRMKENEMLEEQVKGLRIENQYKRQKIIQDLANAKEQELSSQAKRRIDDITVKNLDNMQTEEYMLKREQRADLKSQIQKRAKEILLLDKEISNFDARWDAEKAEIVSRTLLNGAMTGRTRQEMRTEVYNTIRAQYESQRQKLDNKTAARMADALVDKAYYDMLDSKNKSYWSQYPSNLIQATYEARDNIRHRR